MLGTKSRRANAMKQQAETIKHEVERRGEDFGRRAEAMVDALGNAVDRLQELSVASGRRASRRGRLASRRSAEAAREALEQARHAVRQVPDWDQMADMARRTGDRLMPERAAQRRKAERRRRMKVVAGGLGLAGLGATVLAVLGANRRGAAMRERDRLDAEGDWSAARRSTTAVRDTAAAGTGSTASMPSNPGATTGGTSTGGTSDPSSKDLNVGTHPTGSGNGHSRDGSPS
jgi:hypothetical protein